MARDMAMESGGLAIKTTTLTKANTLRTIKMAMGSTNGQMAPFTKALLRMT